jgi:hypothetical protein
MNTHDPAGALRAASDLPHCLFSDRTTPGRELLEDSVRARYADVHGARIDSMHDVLIGLASPEQGLIGVIGTSPAAEHGHLFLEHYLDAPVQDVLSQRVGHVERRALGEVGGLVANRPGAGRWMFSTMSAYLHGSGIQWALFTATAAVRASLARVGVRLVELAPARAERVPCCERWGRYYEADPRVCAARIEQVRHACRHDSALVRALVEAWQEAFAEGRRRGALGLLERSA